MSTTKTGIHTPHDGMGVVSRTVKRLIDATGALTGLVLLSPVFLLIALMLKLSSKGPVIFCQQRIGYRGRPFTIYKFRTMGSEIENQGPQLIAKCTPAMASPLERFLRQRHLDELPQLWNVLRGDMSIVGPRPERQYFIDKIMERDSRYPLIYQMRPGLTSEATLYNGYTDTIDKMVRRLDMDIDYLQRRSLWLDFTIACKTIGSMAGIKLQQPQTNRT